MFSRATLMGYSLATITNLFYIKLYKVSRFSTSTSRPVTFYCGSGTYCTKLRTHESCTHKLLRQISCQNNSFTKLQNFVILLFSNIISLGHCLPLDEEGIAYIYMIMYYSRLGSSGSWGIADRPLIFYL